MARVRQFETAAARRRKDPIVWDIDGREVRLVASLELADLADLIEALQREDDSGNAIRSAAVKRRLLLEIVERFVEPSSVEEFRRITPDLDIHMLNEMVIDLINEYSGAENPTKPSSSSTGSESDGEISMAGAPPVA